MRKAILVFATWTTAATGLGIYQSCCNPDPVNYRLITISGQAERIMDIDLLGSAQTEYYVTSLYEPSPDGIAFDSIAINISYEVETFSFNRKGEMLNRSIACSPGENYEQLEDVIITSNQDYDSSFPGGTDLKDLMSIRQGYNQYLVKGEPVSTFLTHGQIGLGGSLMTFDSPPDQTRIHNLTIRFILKDGREYSTTLEGLQIKSLN